jgi:hypothetical protein
MLKFNDAILKNELLKPVETRKWLKPVTATSSSGTFIGRPWEIYHVQNVTVDGRLIEVYTKFGDYYWYHSGMILIPDYGIHLNIFVGGPEVNFLTVQDAMTIAIKRLLPALETAGKAQALATYGGTYVDKASNSTLTLALDDAPGFNIADWVIRGKDVLRTAGGINLPPIIPPPDLLVPFRLYPSISWSTQRAWRAVNFQDFGRSDADYPWGMPNCITWAEMDRITYGLQSLDHFVFTVDQGSAGEVASKVFLPMYKVTMEKA